MPVNTLWPSETYEFTDPVTGVRLRQLTHYKGHSHHFYFTNPGWYRGGSALLIGSDRENRTNLFGVDLNSGEITQLTDLEPLPLPREVEFLRACLNNVKDEVYFFHGYKLLALDLDTLEQRVIHEMPRGFDVSMINCSMDGQHVYTSISEDMSHRFRVDLLRGYVGFHETWEAMPLSRIEKIAVDGSGSQTVWEEKYWVGHVNTSPTVNHILTFCHEGPWQLVDNRIWGLNVETGEAWKIRAPQQGELVGHEYWHADGQFIGYHGQHQDGRKFLGHIRYDNTDCSEVAFPHETGHIHSNDRQLVVGDAGKVVRLWRWNGVDYDGPRVLCFHYSSMKIQQLHVHPRFTADNKQVVFTSDMNGYGNVYVADVPDFDSLPRLEDL